MNNNNNDKNNDKKRQLVNILSMIASLVTFIVLICFVCNIVKNKSDSVQSTDFTTSVNNFGNSTIDSITSPNSYTLTREFIITPARSL